MRANTREEAIARIKADGMIVTKVEEVTKTGDVGAMLSDRRIKDTPISLMCSQFAIVLKSGLPIVRAIRSVADQTDNRALATTLSNVADDVESGLGLADSFAKYGSKLPPTFIESVRAGENSGDLEHVFERLADYYRKMAKTRSKVRSALIYPTFVLVVAVVVVAIIMVFAVPTFKTTFADMGVELPWPTLAMIAVSDFFVAYWWVLLAVVAAAVVAVKVLKRTNESFRLKWAQMGLKVPVFGKINFMNVSAQYAATMSTMLSAGVSVITAVDVTSRTLSNYAMSTALAGITRELKSGKTLASCLSQTQAFPEFVCQMTDMGEQTGTLEATLDVVADYYGNEVDARTDRALRLLEPIMIVVLAFIVLIILLAVYLPMFSLYSNYTKTM